MKVLPEMTAQNGPPSLKANGHKPKYPERVAPVIELGYQPKGLYLKSEAGLNPVASQREFSLTQCSEICRFCTPSQ